MAGTSTMTKPEREAYLSEPHVAIIAIAEADRGPLAVPVWYDYTPGGHVRVLMQGDSRKMRSITASGRFSLCVQTDAAPYAYVTVEGPVTDVQPYDIETDLRDMAVRYLGAEAGQAYADRAAAGDNGGAGVIVSMRPEHWLSTDYRKPTGG